VIRADRKRRRQADVRQLVVLEHFLDQSLGDFRIRNPLAQVEVQDGPSGVETLQIVLQIERLKNVIGKADRQLTGVRVVGDIVAGAGDIRVFFPVQLSQPVAGPLGGRRLQIVEVAGLFLDLPELIPHVVEDALGKSLPLFRSQPQVLPEEIEAGFVHADDADGVEVIGPVRSGPLLDRAQIMRRIRIQAPSSLFLDRLALQFKTILGDVDQAPEPGFKFRFGT